MSLIARATSPSTQLHPISNHSRWLGPEIAVLSRAGTREDSPGTPTPDAAESCGMGRLRGDMVRPDCLTNGAARFISPPALFGQPETGGAGRHCGPVNSVRNDPMAERPRRYHVAKAADVLFNQRLVTITADDKTDGRGIAEAVMCSVPPAIANAIYDAIGVRFRDLPITAAKVREALS